MTKAAQAFARLDRAKAELRSAQHAVDALRRQHMVENRAWGLREEAFRMAVTSKGSEVVEVAGRG